MKIKLNTNLLLNVIISGFIILSLILWVISSYYSMPERTNEWVNNLKPIDEIISDSISHKQYTNLTDSINEIRSLKNGETFNGSGAGFNFLSTISCFHCDTCGLQWIHHRAFEGKVHRQIYLELGEWTIKSTNEIGPFPYIDSVQFYAKSGQGYIRKLTLLADKKDHSKPIMQLVDIPVKFWYNHRDQCLMIPISQSIKQVWDIAMGVVGFALFIYFLYLLSSFLHFVLDLSKGLSFTNSNVRRLRLIALSFLISPIAVILFILLLKMGFNSYFTSDVVLNNDIWYSSWKMLAIGMIFLVLYKAFRQGKLLKDEQELTV